MCGIAGVLDRDAESPAREAALARMLRRLHHRGPDGTGVERDRGLAMASTRLAVIDVDGAGQPLRSEDGQVSLIFNGEIYDYLELRRELAGRGHAFATKGDGEVIVHLYEDHGLDFVHHLRGMFALALWDRRRRRLVLARDRMGEKPLYLHQTDGALYFASEMKSLLACGAVGFELDPDAVNAFFHLGYVPEPGTALRGVRKLPAASLLVIDADSWSRVERRYWSMEEAPPLEGDPAALIRAELERVSELVVRADVRVGIALSGGLDSSALAALAARARPGTLHAFGVGYPEADDIDERGQAEALCATLGIPFHGVEIGTEEMAARFPGIVLAGDDPIADPAGQGYFAVARAARDAGVPVLLQGQGADELFWGYPWLGHAAQASREIEAGEPRAERMVFHDCTADFGLARRRMPVHYSADFLRLLDEGALATAFTFPRPWPPIATTLTRLACETYLMANGIAQGDRLSMASSVEVRLPFADHRLVETVIGLRKTQPDDHLPPKAWLRRALAGLLPAEVLARPKRGFGTPMREWQRALFARHGDSLRQGFLVGARILDGAMVEVLARGAIEAQATIPISFKALVLETWCRAMAGQAGASGDAIPSGARIWNEHPIMAEPEFALNAEVAHREIEGQILLLTPNDDVLYTLNDTGRLAWEMLLGGAGVDGITSRIAETYCLPPEEARRDVDDFLADLERLGVVSRRP